MTAENGLGDTVRSAVSTVATAVGQIVSKLVIAAFIVGYLAVWLGLAAFHYTAGDLMQSAVTVGVFVVPMVGLGLWRVGKAYDVDIGEFGPDVDPISS